MPYFSFIGCLMVVNIQLLVAVMVVVFTLGL
jgi:hypothetical protein